SGWGDSLLLTVVAILATVGIFFLFGMIAAYAQMAARTSEADLVRALADTLNEGIQITAGGRIVYANRSFLDLIGFDEFGDLKPLGEAFAGESQAAEALFRLACAVERGESRQEEFEVANRASPGHPARWYRLSVRPVHAAGRETDLGPLAVWSICDIGAERSREADLRRTFEAALAPYERLPFGILMATEDGRIERVNGALERSLRTGPQGRKTAHLRDILSIDGIALLKSDGAHGSGRIDLDFVREDGTSWPATVIGVAGLDQGGFVAAVVDRLADAGNETIGRSPRTRFAPLVRSAPFGIATVDAGGRIVSSNPAFARLLPDSATGDAGHRIDALAQRIDEDARPAFEAAFAAALRGKANIPPMDVTVGENRTFTRRVYMSPLAPAKGAREAAILYVIDTTEQKALERKFAQSQKMEAIGKLAGGIAHDFNNVLTAVIGFSDLLLQTHRPVDPAYKNIRAIKSSANRAAGMVNQLLAFSRRQTLQPEILQLGEVLTDLSVLLNRVLGEKIDLKISTARDLWDVKADRTQFGQVVINLAVNARDAMPGGGRLTIRTRNFSERDSLKFEPHGIATGEYVLIEVEDTGTGMTPDVMANIFEPFFTTKGVGKGTGLGLSTVYGIVRQTGGTIIPESTLGKGTTFRVYLPRYHADSDGKPVEPTTPKPERRRDLTGTGCVLLVEDEDAVRTFAVEALKRQGYEVLQAATGRDAIDVMAASGGEVDIVVSDVMMPEMDGPTLLSELRKSNPDLKIIFVSGYPDEAFRSHLDPAAKFTFLPKPFTLAQLAAKVKEELNKQ
ncbi:MAG: ATP-binding protein, partial [Hyphomicrobiaceae bacterium]